MSETKNKESSNQTSGFSTFITGAVVGAVITYLFTTESGRKIKDELLKEGSKLLENVGDEVERAQQIVSKEEDKLLEEVDKKKKEIEAEVHTAAKQVKKEVQEITSSAVDAVESVPEQVEAIQKKGRRFFFSKKHPGAES